jgi:hypothetical protein
MLYFISMRLQNATHQTHKMSNIWSDRRYSQPYQVKARHVTFAVLLKCFQRLHYVPSLETTPEVIVNHVRQCLGNLKARRLAAGTALRVALMIDDPVDIVNAMLGELQRHQQVCDFDG